MISSGNGAGFIPSISVFQARFAFSKCTVQTYKAGADTNAPYEATVLREYFTPS
jgi:hypothetical protein